MCVDGSGAVVMARFVGSCVLATVTLWLVVYDTNAESINVGILPDLEETAHLAYSWSPDDTSVRLVPMPYAQSWFSYDKTKEIHTFLESESIHCVLGDYDIELAQAAETLGVCQLWTSLRQRNLSNNVTCNLLPSVHEISTLLWDIIVSYEFRLVGVIYQDFLDKSMITTLVEDSSNSEVVLRFYKLPSEHTDGVRLREIILSMRSAGIVHFLVLTNAFVTRSVFTQARRLGIISMPYTWIVLNLGTDDVVSIILDDLLTNVTMVDFVNKNSPSIDNANGLDHLGVALMTDALTAVEMASQQLPPQDPVTLSGTRYHLARAIHKIDFIGETGHVAFDDEGHRSNFTVNIEGYNGHSFVQLGNWESDPSPPGSKHLTLKNLFPLRNSTDGPFKNRVAHVVIILEPPFAMLREGHERLKGNARFEGFAVDFMEAISRQLQFQYSLYVVPDGNFGIELPSGEWNGMIGEVLSGNATMTVAPLSINTGREMAVDFTKPFMSRTIVALMQTPESTSGYFQFMNPLSSEVWMCILASMILMTILLFVLEKYSTNPNKIMPKLDSNESAWFIFGALVGGGSETSPVTIPGRIITSAWWFFALIFTSTYTANLAAFLTVTKMNAPINNVGDLVGQNEIKYGTVKNSGVMNFFSRTNIEPFNKMWTKMSEIDIDAMVDNTSEGLARVKEGNYAFLWDSTVTSYWASTDCDVMEIGPPFDSKGFGIAVPPGATYLEELSLAVLKLADSGYVNVLEEKWWSSTLCEDSRNSQTNEITELQLENMAGLFFVLLAGIGFAFIALLLERLIVKCCKPKVQRHIRSLRKKSFPDNLPSSIPLDPSNRQNVWPTGNDRNHVNT